MRAEPKGSPMRPEAEDVAFSPTSEPSRRTSRVRGSEGSKVDASIPPPSDKKPGRPYSRSPRKRDNSSRFDN